jgi:Sigma-70 region 2
MNDSMTEDEFSTLFRQTAGRLHAYAVRQVGRDAADDLVSETYAIAWRRRERIGIPALPRLFVVARNVASTMRRSKRRSDQLWLTAVREQWRNVASESPESEVVTRDVALAALGRCSATDRGAPTDRLGWARACRSRHRHGVLDASFHRTAQSRSSSVHRVLPGARIAGITRISAWVANCSPPLPGLPRSRTRHCP